MRYEVRMTRWTGKDRNMERKEGREGREGRRTNGTFVDFVFDGDESPLIRVEKRGFTKQGSYCYRHLL